MNWEAVNLKNGSEFRFIYTTGYLSLGDAETGTGALNIDETSVVFAGNSYGSGEQAINASVLATVRNAGLIDLTNDTPLGYDVRDTFTVRGIYIGQGGTLALHTRLESDDAPPTG